MKVKELIANLQEFDQEREIWILYDSYAAIEPEIYETAVGEDKIKPGDYICAVS